jgi:REP element-mobilizing transposase RayT
VFPAVRSALRASSRADFRILEFSVQKDHVHLIVEADHRRALSGGLRGVAIRLARAVNRVLGRRGRVWGRRVSWRRTPGSRALDGEGTASSAPMNVQKHLEVFVPEVNR